MPRIVEKEFIRDEKGRLKGSREKYVSPPDELESEIRNRIDWELSFPDPEKVPTPTSPLDVVVDFGRLAQELRASTNLKDLGTRIFRQLPPADRVRVRLTLVPAPAQQRITFQGSTVLMSCGCRCHADAATGNGTP